MNCTAWAEPEKSTLDLLTEANLRQLDEINRLEIQVIRQRDAIAVLSQDRPFAEMIATLGTTLPNAICFGLGVGFVYALQWVLG